MNDVSYNMVLCYAHANGVSLFLTVIYVIISCRIFSSLLYLVLLLSERLFALFVTDRSGYTITTNNYSTLG